MQVDGSNEDRILLTVRTQADVVNVVGSFCILFGESKQGLTLCPLAGAANDRANKRVRKKERASEREIDRETMCHRTREQTPILISQPAPDATRLLMTSQVLTRHSLDGVALRVRTLDRPA